MQKLTNIILTMILCLLSTHNTYAQVEEIKGKVVAKINTTASTSLKTGIWYMIQNRGRNVYNYESISDKQVRQSTNALVPGDDVTADNAGYLMQLVAVSEERPDEYYIMTGHGNWLCDLEESRALTTTSDITRRGTFTIGKCVTSGHWYFQSASGYILDGNGNGQTAVGYGTTVPTSTGGNNDHALYVVSIDSADALSGAALVNRSLKTGGLFSITSQRTTSMSITDPADHRLLSQNTSKTNKAQWWLLTPLSNGGIALRNYSTGLYIQATGGTSARYTSAASRSTLYAKASAKSTATKGLVTISSKPNFDGKTCLHDDASHNVVNWSANNANNENPASDWGIVPIEGITPEDIKAHFEELSGFVTPTDGITVQIRNAETGNQICEDGKGKLVAVAPNAEDISQYWVMEQTSAGQYAFRNVQTDHYFTYVNGSGNFNDQKASTTKSSYVLNETSDVWERTYHICAPGKTNLYYTHTTSGNAPTDRDQQYIVNSTTDNANTHWVLVKADLNHDDIEESQQAFEAYTNISSNTVKYTTAMNKYFTDSSYSDLNASYQSMTDEELTAAMKADDVHDYLIKIALKVKNNTWNEEDEMSRDFRVANYQVYTDNLQSKGLMSMGYGFGRLSNPTGIVVKSGDIVSIFCDQAAPAGCELKLEAVENTDAQGQLYTLNKGVNIYNFPVDATLYIFYQIQGLNSKKLTSFPDVRIHIEGGRLNGYFDKTRGHTDQTWKHLRKNLLKESNIINIKTPHFVFCFDNQRVQNACPTYMERVLQAWDNMAYWENELMGYNDTWIPGISEIQRNIYNWFSKDVYMGGSMMTALYGVQTLSGNIAEHMDYKKMESDGVWGPAHECGHLRQNLIYTLGSLESSNNLFVEVVCYHLGRATQRSAYFNSIVENFVGKSPWLKYEGKQITRMLYQLYLYFHVRGVNPNFYPQVFNELRKDPMIQDKSSHEVKGGEEYLKLARTMCKVAGADLSEFFEAYGFFVPLSRTQVYENGIFWNISTTQEEIDEALAYMHSFPNTCGNMIFIEDRIEPILATYEGHAEGETKKGYNRTDAGELGQFTDFGIQSKLENYYYTVTEAGKVSVKGSSQTGLVGFKVYDEQGKLAFLANRPSFTLPADLLSQEYTLVAAMGDGSDIELTTETPTGINTVESQRTGSMMYDLQGRRVAHPVRGGIYLMDGKKVIY